MQQEAIELKLEVQALESYEIEIGEVNSLDLGQFQGNDIDLVFVFYQISKASDVSLKDDFKVEHSFDKEKISLDSLTSLFNINLYFDDHAYIQIQQICYEN